MELLSCCDWKSSGTRLLQCAACPSGQKEVSGVFLLFLFLAFLETGYYSHFLRGNPPPIIFTASFCGLKGISKEPSIASVEVSGKAAACTVSRDVFRQPLAFKFPLEKYHFLNHFLSVMPSLVDLLANGRVLCSCGLPKTV